MKRYDQSLSLVACAGCFGIALTASASAQSGSDGDRPAARQQQQQQQSPPASSAPRAPANDPPPLPEPRVPLPRGGPAPIGADRLPDVPPPRRSPDPADRVPDRPPQRRIAPNPGVPSGIDRPRDPGAPLPDRAGSDSGRDSDNGRDSGRDRDRDRDHDRDRDRDRDDRAWRYRRPPIDYYDYWVYDRAPVYDDGYRGRNDGDRGYAPEPLDAGDARAAADRDLNRSPAGALLPPEDLVDDADASPALRKALDASPQYREATAQLVRAWAEYARAADQVLQRLKTQPRYKRALAALRDADAKLAALRDRGGNVPAVNLVTATQDALLARKEVRRLEQQAIDADPLARRAKEKLDQAVERRKKIRDDIASKLPPGDRAVQPAQ